MTIEELEKNIDDSLTKIYACETRAELNAAVAEVKEVFGRGDNINLYPPAIIDAIKDKEGDLELQEIKYRARERQKNSEILIQQTCEAMENAESLDDLWKLRNEAEEVFGKDLPSAVYDAFKTRSVGLGYKEVRKVENEGQEKIDKVVEAMEKATDLDKLYAIRDKALEVFNGQLPSAVYDAFKTRVPGLSIKDANKEEQEIEDKMDLALEAMDKAKTFEQLDAVLKKVMDAYNVQDMGSLPDPIQSQYNWCVREINDMMNQKDDSMDM